MIDEVRARLRMATGVLAVVGALISAYLLAYKWQLARSIACPTAGCEIVNTSRYAQLGPVPVAAIGLAGYLVIAGVAAAGLQVERIGPWPVGTWLLLLSTGGLGFTAYLTYVEVAVLRAICAWCVASALVITAVFAVSVAGARRSARGASGDEHGPSQDASGLQ